MFNKNFFVKLSSIVALLCVLGFAVNAHAGSYEVLETWETSADPKTKTGDATYEYTTESATEQYVDSAGNTVEKVLSKRYRIETRPVVTKTVHYPWFKERHKRSGRERTRRGKVYATTTSTTDVQKLFLGTTIVSESIIAYYVAPEEEVVEEEVSVVSEIWGDGTKTIGVSTVEEYRAMGEISTLNTIVGQEWALSRGWTGKGSTIGILDSGIDTDHSEFAGRIKYKYDTLYGLDDVEDYYGHGTHVAGIAAAGQDGEGMFGIAPDADLAVVRITTSGSYSMSRAKTGLKWLVDNTDAVVANVSANTSYNGTYNARMTNHGNGIFTNSDINYGGTNYYNQEDPQQWADAIANSEIVLVVAAGNQDNGYVQNPATFATATDAEGNLLLDGRMIIAGMWNTTFNQIEGAKSGHVCKDYTTQCNDVYRTSDFYLLAPGANITSAWKDGTYRSQSGTSMAAPVIAGAVAVLHQQWPYMKGENLVQVLLQTANKNIVGYNVNTHGQGLLDLKKATEPIGELGISTTGRTGATESISGSLSFAGDSELSALADVKAVDVRLPTSVSSDGTMNYTNHSVQMNSNPVSFVGAEYKTNLVEDKFGQTHSLKMNGVVDQNSQYQVGAFYEFTF